MKKDIIVVLIYLILFGFRTETVAASVSLAIDPPIIRIKATPPASVESKIKISNLSDEAIDLDIFLRPFEAHERWNGDIQYIFEEDSSYKKFLSSIVVLENNSKISNINLEAHQAKIITLFIPIFKDTGMRDYYFSVVFGSKTPLSTEGSYFKLVAAIASNVLLSIGKPDNIKPVISEVKVAYFMLSGPVNIRILINNKANQNISIGGRARIKNMLGQTSKTLIIPEQNILASSKKYIFDNTYSEVGYNKGIKEPSIIFNETFLLGKYTLEADLLTEYGDTLTAKTNFIVFPAHIVGIIIMVILFLISIYLRVSRRYLN